jgi:glyoxylase-like metal-dependent hydrolase (beta-lactamase superfamily II)
MPNFRYTRGLHDLGKGLYAWLLPDGSWGWSNAGLIVDSGQTLLVDTLFDLHLTREMLDAMRDAVPAARDIGALVNTHGNGDHTFGNQLLEGRPIIAAAGCAEDMRHRPPEQLAQWQREWQNMGIAGRFWYEVMGAHFDFQGIRMVLPNDTFSGERRLRVGDKEVILVEVGPAHTRGDVLVYVPADRTVFTGDILFNGGHPAIWAGPVSNWIAACERMLAWDLETVVPGHGPITDKNGIREMRDYLAYLLAESARCRDAGMSFEQAVERISLDRWANWGESERICVNVHACYRELEADPQSSEAPGIRMALLEMMGRRYFEAKADGARTAGHVHGPGCGHEPQAGR